MRALVQTLLFGLFAGFAGAELSIHVWDVNANEETSPFWSDSRFWEGGSVPANDGTAAAAFPGIFEGDFNPNLTSIELNGDVNLDSLFFGESAFYSFYSSEGAAFRIQNGIQAASGEYDSEIYFGIGLTLMMEGFDTTIDVGWGTEIEVASNFHVDGEAYVEIIGGGTLLLSGDNSHGGLLGSIQVTEGFLGLGQDTSAGGAAIHLGDPENPGSNTVGLIAVDGDRRIGNRIFVHGHFETLEDDYERNELNLEGEVTFTSDTNLFNYGGLLNFLGGVSETSAGTVIDIWADEPVLFTGPTGITGGINMQDGAVLFTDYGALPDVSPGSFFGSDSSDTYIGLMIDDSTDRDEATTYFLSLFDRADFSGTVGFDTDPGNEGTLNSYGAPIDLTGFTDGRIGSVTQAELTGEITPSGQDYQFGNGGGVLLVGSLLEDIQIFEEAAATPPNEAAVGVPTERGISVVSNPNDPLTVFINNANNDFSGNVTAEHSAVIFGDVPGALPTEVNLVLREGGYIGLQDATRDIASYLGQFTPDLDMGVIGFDSPDRDTNRVITDTIDLSIFTESAPEIYLGTATWVNLGGNIIVPDDAQNYFFAGYKGGRLNVTSVLTDGETDLGVVIGDQDTPATHGHLFVGGGEENDLISSVRLEGANTYSGGTRLEAGELVITNNASLGSGPINVVGEAGGFTDVLMYGIEEYGDFDYRAPILSPDASDLVINNPLQLDSILEIDVQIAMTDENLTLAGDIAGSGGIDKNGNGTLNLSGDNSAFDGGLYITEGTVNINTDTAAGTGPVGFGGGGSGSGQTLVFNSMAPTIGGLYEIRDQEDEYYSYSTAGVELASGSTLTIDVNGTFLNFGGTIYGDGAVRVQGEGVQFLSGYNSFTGGLEIGGGANLVASESGSLGGGYPDAPLVTLDGGTLTLDLDDSTSIEAYIEFGAGGGEIRGNGTLLFSDPLAIGEGASISPGFSVGRIDFEGPLELGELGSLTVEIGDGDNNEIISDVIYADSIDITATSSSPFSINVMSEDGELPTQFDPLQAYSWTIMLSGQELTSFDASLFNLSVASALEDLAGEGIWALNAASDGSVSGESFFANNLVVLSFTPVPEPSTFALVAVGLVLVTFHAGRRRRRI